MKNLILTYLLILTVFATNGQKVVEVSNGKIEIPNSIKLKEDFPTKMKNCNYGENYYAWIVFDRLLNQEEYDQMKNLGIDFIDYFHKAIYSVKIDLNSNLTSLRNQFPIYGICPIPIMAKIAKEPYNKILSKNQNQTEVLKLYVSLFEILGKEELSKYLFESNIHVEKLDGSISEYGWELEVQLRDLEKLAKLPLVRQIENQHEPIVAMDENTINSHGASLINTSENNNSGLKLAGNGINIIVGDGGVPGNHIDFLGRSSLIGVVLPVLNSYSSHASHVNGIINGNGSINPRYVGMAPRSKTLVENYFNYNGYLNSLYFNDSARISSNSYSAPTTFIPYDDDCYQIDNKSKLLPKFLFVFSAGNYGPNMESIPNGFQNAKNSIVVADLNETFASTLISSSSSRGPLPDGRLKPDISAIGTNVMSTQNGNSYSSKSGTSMACPVVSGSAALVMEAYKLKFPGLEADGALIKTLLLNTAEDLGNTGQDYTYGWGKLNVYKAVKALNENRFFIDSISQSQTKQFNINIPPNVAEVKIMTYWTDKAGTSVAVKCLINDLSTNLQKSISTQTGTSIQTYLPWRLVPSSSAIKGIDTLNNVEQISINSPNSGLYTLNVTGNSIPFGPQKFYVVIEYIMNNNLMITYPNGGEMLEPGTYEKIRWDYKGTTGTFNVQYSVNNGSTWNTISSSVPSNQRFINWLVPSINTSNLKIRVTRGSVQGVSTNSSVILGKPLMVNYFSPCSSVDSFYWSSVPGATSYDILLYNGSFMEVIGNTTATNFKKASTPGTNYFSIRARLETKAGLRTNGISFINNATNSCASSVRTVSINTNAMLQASLFQNKVFLQWGNIPSTTVSDIKLEKSMSLDFSDLESLAENIEDSGSLSGMIDLEFTKIGVWYYRLAIKNLDGTTTYSNTVSVKINDLLDMVCFPNPAKDHINLKVNNREGIFAVNIYDANYRLAYSGKMNFVKGEPQELPISHLNTGVYYIDVLDEKSENRLAGLNFIIE